MTVAREKHKRDGEADTFVSIQERLRLREMVRIGGSDFENIRVP